MTALLVLACCIFVIVVGGLLVFRAEYKIGLVGMAGLAAISVAAFTRAEEVVIAANKGILETVDISPRAVLVWIGLALFYVHVIWRTFLVKKWRALLREISKEV